MARRAARRGAAVTQPLAVVPSSPSSGASSIDHAANMRRGGGAPLPLRTTACGRDLIAPSLFCTRRPRQRPTLDQRDCLDPVGGHPLIRLPHLRCCSRVLGIDANVHQVHEAPRARRQPGEGVSTAFPKLLPFTACGGKQRNAVRGMNLVLSDARLSVFRSTMANLPIADSLEFEIPGPCSHRRPAFRGLSPVPLGSPSRFDACH